MLLGATGPTSLSFRPGHTLSLPQGRRIWLAIRDSSAQPTQERSLEAELRVDRAPVGPSARFKNLTVLLYRPIS
jgi:hypothetical protein